jgi:hypothetical protein
MKRNHSFFSAKRRYKVTTLVKITLAYLGISSLPISGVAGPIKQIALDNYVIQRVPVATGKGNTVIMFPSPIQALYASRCAIQEQPNADFLLDFQAGQYWFTVRALKKDVEDYITVIYERKAYVIHITASETPLYTVSFFRDDRSASGGPSLTRRVTPARLISLLDKAKAYNLFLAQEPGRSRRRALRPPRQNLRLTRDFGSALMKYFASKRTTQSFSMLPSKIKPTNPSFTIRKVLRFSSETNIYTASVVDASVSCRPNPLRSHSLRDHRHSRRRTQQSCAEK